MQDRYMHTKRLGDAIKRLYMIGNQPYRPTTNADTGDGGLVGTMFGAAEKSKSDKQKKWDMQNAIADAKATREKQDIMRDAIKAAKTGRARGESRDIATIRGLSADSAEARPINLSREGQGKELMDRRVQANMANPDRDVFLRQLEDQRAAEAATLAPMGDQWTEKGLEQMAKSVEVQKNDVNMSKLLMERARGMGGTDPQIRTRHDIGEF
jgi:hypothetical protein